MHHTDCTAFRQCSKLRQLHVSINSAQGQVIQCPVCGNCSSPQFLVLESFCLQSVARIWAWYRGGTSKVVVEFSVPEVSFSKLGTMDMF